MPFTASYTDVWTIAPTRVLGCGGVPETSSASTIVLFQSVTTSAAAACGAASAVNAISTAASLGLIGPSFPMESFSSWFLPLVCEQGRDSRRGNSSERTWAGGGPVVDHQVPPELGREPDRVG